MIAAERSESSTARDNESLCAHSTTRASPNRSGAISAAGFGSTTVTSQPSEEASLATGITSGPLPQMMRSIAGATSSYDSCAVTASPGAAPSVASTYSRIIPRRALTGPLRPSGTTASSSALAPHSPSRNTSPDARTSTRAPTTGAPAPDARTTVPITFGSASSRARERRAPSAPELSGVRRSIRISTSPLHPVPSPHTSSSSDRPSYVMISATPLSRTRTARPMISPSRQPLLRSPTVAPSPRTTMRAPTAR